MKVAAALFVFACFVPVLAQSSPASSVRDPFVYGLKAPSPQRVERTVVKTPGPQEAEKPVQDAASKPVQEKPAPVAPAVTVTGIVSGPAQTAILSNAGRSYVVRVGDKLGDYRVSAIGARSVTLATRANSFKLPLE